MDYREILYHTDGAVAYLTLNKPDKINALSRQMIAEMIAALERTAGDETVKVLVLRAAGSHFCAGHDLAEMVDQDMKEYKFIFDQCSRMMTLLHEIPQPVIGQVQGIATAAGCQLAAWCDLVIAADDASFATPGVQLGLFCTTPMVAISRAIGRKAALEMLLTGRPYPAAEARELGLVNRVVPRAELEAATNRLAQQIAGASRLALQFGKQGFYAQVDMADDKAMHYAKHTIALNNLAADAQAGIKAFLAKTKPQWQNR